LIRNSMAGQSNYNINDSLSNVKSSLIMSNRISKFLNSKGTGTVPLSE
jgi:hypothetical protein